MESSAFVYDTMFTKIKTLLSHNTLRVEIGADEKSVDNNVIIILIE